MYFNNAEWLLSRLFPNQEWSVKTSEKEIFLTFDDGPIPEVTEFVLEELGKRNALATFFCVGENIRKHPEIFQKVVQANHRIGNHTFNHLNGWKNSDEEYLANVLLCEEAIESNGFNYSGKLLFRPPYGKASRKQVALIKDKYRIIMWNVLTGDFDNNLPAEKCLQKALKYTKKGSIVIFHDSIKAEKNMRYVLPRFLDHFSEKGYKFKLL